MASAGNWFETRRKSHKLREKNITTSATVTTYTVRTGGPTYDFIEDAIVNVTTAESCDITITMPDGTYAGQIVIINFVTEASAETVTVTASTGSGGDSTMTSAGQYMVLMWTNATTGWVAISESVAS